MNSRTSYFRLYFTSNLNKIIYFNIIANDIVQTNESSELPDTASWSSLYVPSHGSTIISNTDYLFISTLVILAIFSTVVSIVGHRYFTLGKFLFLI